MNGRFPHILPFLILGIQLVSACQSNTGTSDIPVTEDPVAAMQAALLATSEANQTDRSQQNDRWLSELDAAESRWESAHVDQYKLMVLYVNSGQNIAQYHTIHVINGEIVEESAACSEQVPTCFIKEVNPKNVTVPGLFGMARNAILNDEITENGTEFNFHPTYGVPEWIALKTANQLPWYWHIELFEPLE